MDFVQSCQERYKLGDFGDATPEQRNIKTGKYPYKQTGKNLLIEDAGKEFKVMYETEAK